MESWSCWQSGTAASGIPGPQLSSPRLALFWRGLAEYCSGVGERWSGGSSMSPQRLFFGPILAGYQGSQGIHKEDGLGWVQERHAWGGSRRDIHGVRGRGGTWRGLSWLCCYKIILKIGSFIKNKSLLGTCFCILGSLGASCWHQHGLW